MIQRLLCMFQEMIFKAATWAFKKQKKPPFRLYIQSTIREVCVIWFTVHGAQTKTSQDYTLNEKKETTAHNHFNYIHYIHWVAVSHRLSAMSL